MPVTATNRMGALAARCQQIQDTAQAEGRDLTADEQAEMEALMDAFDVQAAMVPATPRAMPASSSIRNEMGGAGSRRFSSMFAARGRAASGTIRSAGDFLRVAATNYAGMIANAAAGQSEAIGEDGGLAVPPQYSAALLDAAADQSLFLQRANVIPALSNQLVLPKWDNDGTGGKRGGLTAVWTAEAGSATVQKARMVPMNIRVHKVATWLSLTSEMQEDAPATSRQIETLASGAIAAAIDIACLRGNGVGKPLGIINAPGTIAQAAEGGQTAGTVVPQNFVKMLARLAPGSYARAEWLLHPTVVAQLFLLQMTVKNVAGTENVGGYAPAGWFFIGPDGSMTLLGRPVTVTDACNPVGSLGDVVLADLSQYLVPARNSLRVEQSVASGWSTDEVGLRVIMRLGGQPLPEAPAKLADGANTTSPFVALAARA
jgi:HK97 family phage major capsid protein